LKVVGADHTNFRVKDLDASLGFYRDVLGLKPFGLEEYHRGERPIVSLRITKHFILHLTPDPEFERGSTGGYDHLALVVEDAEPDELRSIYRSPAQRLRSSSRASAGLVAKDQPCTSETPTATALS
jgi:catechol 2,3-dioxygenase-like lactoylglutathione lyase family enzyme